LPANKVLCKQQGVSQGVPNNFILSSKKAKPFPIVITLTSFDIEKLRGKCKNTTFIEFFLKEKKYYPPDC